MPDLINFYVPGGFHTVKQTADFCKKAIHCLKPSSTLFTFEKITKNTNYFSYKIHQQNPISITIF